MQEYVSRLIDCGMPRCTAVYICNRYRRLGQLRELAQYVDDVERETNVTLADVFE